jgi:hemerythrin
MADIYKTIETTIQTHHHIKEDFKQADGSVADIEAIFALNKEYARWAQSSLQELEEKQARLQQALDKLEIGLVQHFSYEEQYLPALLGAVPMKTIMTEHREISAQLRKTRDCVHEGTPAGLTQRAMLTKKAVVLAEIRELIEVLEEHAAHEEKILQTLRKVPMV